MAKRALIEEMIIIYLNKLKKCRLANLILALDHFIHNISTEALDALFKRLANHLPVIPRHFFIIPHNYRLLAALARDQHNVIWLGQTQRFDNRFAPIKNFKQRLV